jgi:hypothetical protein
MSTSKSSPSKPPKKKKKRSRSRSASSSDDEDSNKKTVTKKDNKKPESGQTWIQTHINNGSEWKQMNSEIQKRGQELKCFDAIESVVQLLSTPDVKFHKSDVFVSAILKQLSVKRMIQYLKDNQSLLKPIEREALIELGKPATGESSTSSSVSSSSASTKATLVKPKKDHSPATEVTKSNTKLNKGDAVRDEKDKQKRVGMFLRLSSSNPSLAVVKWPKDKQNNIESSKTTVALSQLIKCGVFNIV